MRKRILAALLAALMLASLTPALAAGSYWDIAGHPAEEAMRRVAEAGLLAGYRDGSLRPDEPVTVGQLAVVLGRVLRADIQSSQGQPWYTGAMDAATRLGYPISAAPTETLSRRAALTILARALVPVSGEEVLPEGLELPAEERFPCAALLARELVSEEELRQNTTLTRAELATFLLRILDEVMELPARTYLPEAKEAARALITDKYAGDYTLSWAEAHDYPALWKRIYLNALDIESDTEYLIWVNKTYQRVNIFVKTAAGWKFDRVFLCCTGADWSPTPSGTYKTTLKERGWFHYDYSVFPVVRFWKGGYAFHSQLHYPGGSAKISDPALGYPASHGCVRMLDADISWIHQTIPIGTTVYVH
ncbi:MAG: L,D-transpeptidase family protein [bacterium]